MSLRFALRSDTGRQRDNNEDYAQALPELGLFIVADGMGGHAAGEVASHLAVETVSAVVARQPRPRRVRDEAPILGEAVLAAHQAVGQRAEELSLHGMGTTLTAVRLRGRTATIAHVGDTRLGLLRNGRLRTLTRDHTIVAMLLESGSLTEAEAKSHPERHVLTQAVGPPVAIEPDVKQVRIPAGSRLVLSTDGLHDVVSEAEIEELASDADLESAAARLIERANAHGGPDNITVLLVETGP